MENILIYFALIMVGLCMGSFACASVWRLRAKQLVEDKNNNEEYDKNEYKKLSKLISKSVINDRSKCLDCSYTLCWYDMIPLFSWILLKGKCRNCHKKIGYLEPLSEVGVMLFFVLSFVFWPYPLNSNVQIFSILLWLIAGVELAILFIYDLKWFLLPNKQNFSVIGIGAISSLLVLLSLQDKFSTFISIIGSVAILGGLYWFLNKISDGRWVGFGDVKLGLGLGLLLADYKLALIALFSANLIGCIIVFPSLVIGKLKRDSHVPFGPLLIIGFVIAGLFGNHLVNYYLSLMI